MNLSFAKNIKMYGLVFAVCIILVVLACCMLPATIYHYSSSSTSLESFDSDTNIIIPELMTYGVDTTDKQQGTGSFLEN